MVLRCPSCSELRFFGRTQVLGELVVCPRCETVFGWRGAGALQPSHDDGAAKPNDADGTEAKP